MENEKHHIIPYRTYLYILAILIVFTLISVAITQVYLGALTVVLALVIASIKSTFVLRIFMHLKFEKRLFTVLVTCVLLLISSIIIITLLDYIYR